MPTIVGNSWRIIVDRRKVRNLDEFAQLCTFIERAEAIIAQANAAALELTGDSRDVAITSQSGGLRKTLEEARKLKADFEYVLKVQHDGVSNQQEELAFIMALHNIYGLEHRGLWYGQRDQTKIDEALAEMGVTRTISFDFTGFVKRHTPPRTTPTSGTNKPNRTVANPNK